MADGYLLGDGGYIYSPTEPHFIFPLWRDQYISPYLDDLYIEARRLHDDSKPYCPDERSPLLDNPAAPQQKASKRFDFGISKLSALWPFSGGGCFGHTIVEIQDIEELERKYETQSRELDGVRRERDNIKQSLKQEKKTSEQKLESLRAEQKKIIDQKEAEWSKSMEAISSQLQDEKSKAEAVTFQLQDEKSKAEAIASQLRDEKSKVEAVTSQLQNEKSKMEAILSQLQDKKSKTEAIISQLRDEKSKMKAISSQLQDEKSKMKAITSQLQDEKSKTEAISSQLQDEKSKMKSITSQLQDEKSKAEAITSQLHDEKSKVEAIKSQLESKVEAISSQLQDEKSKAEAIMSQLQDEKSKVKAISSQLRDAESKVKAITSQLQDEKSKVAGLQKHLKNKPVVTKAHENFMSSLSRNVSRTFTDDVIKDELKRFYQGDYLSWCGDLKSIEIYEPEKAKEKLQSKGIINISKSYMNEPASLQFSMDLPNGKSPNVLLQAALSQTLCQTFLQDAYFLAEGIETPEMQGQDPADSRRRLKELEDMLCKVDKNFGVDWRIQTVESLEKAIPFGLHFVESKAKKFVQDFHFLLKEVDDQALNDLAHLFVNFGNLALKLWKTRTVIKAHGLSRFAEQRFDARSPLIEADFVGSPAARRRLLGRHVGVLVRPLIVSEPLGQDGEASKEVVWLKAAGWVSDFDAIDELIMRMTMVL